MIKNYINLDSIVSNGVITGSSGFLGENLLDYLGVKFNLIPTSKSGKKGKVWDITSNYYPNLEPMSLDFLIHSAALISEDEKRYSDIIDTNILGTLRTLEFAKKNNIKKYIYISSVPVIGKPINLPITENHLTEPNTMYHTSKLAGEHVCRQFSIKQKNIKIYILRIPSPLGLNMRENTLIPTLLHNAKNALDIKIEGYGLRRQSYLDIRDLSNVIDFILSKNVTPGIYNVCSDKSISNIDLAKIINNMFGNRSKILTGHRKVDSDSLFWDIDNRKIASEIGGYKFYDIKSSLEYLSENCIF